MSGSERKRSAGARRRDIIKLAREQHQQEGRVEIDNNALLSEGEDNGCYAAAWVWVDFAGTKFDREKEKQPSTERKT